MAKDYVDAKLRGSVGDCIPVLRLSKGFVLGTIELKDSDQIFMASSPSVMDNADYWNYIINDGDGNVYVINSIDLDFDI